MNAVHLIGLVACRPRPCGDAGDQDFLLIIGGDHAGRRMDRQRVVVEDRAGIVLGELAPGATVYVEGRLSRHGGERRVSVIATCAWLMLPAPPLPSSQPPTRTHTPPREHERSGHWRRVAIGTPRERLIQVRPTIVRPAATAP